MKNKILLVITILLVVIYCVSFPKKETFNLPEEQDIKIKVLLKDNNIITLSLNEYLIGVLAGEMPASFDIEALKAQAIASRSYVMSKIKDNNSYDVTTTTNDQVYLSNEEMKEKWGNDYEKYYEKINEAVNETNNLVMKNNDEIIRAYYFAISNGYTEESSEVFGNSSNYLTSVDSSWDESVKNFEVTTKYSKEDFCSALNINCNNITITNINLNKTNHVDNLKVNNIIFTGLEMRKKLNLRSTDFKIEISDYIYITTKGYGHDVGMSEYGANEMAKLGYKYDEILNHYYQNITITSI